MKRRAIRRIVEVPKLDDDIEQTLAVFRAIRDRDGSYTAKQFIAELEKAIAAMQPGAPAAEAAEIFKRFRERLGQVSP